MPSRFVSTIVHGFAFGRWKADRKAAGLGLHDPAEWSQEDYDSTVKAAETAAGLLLSVSVEGKTVSRSGIQTGWNAVGDSLTLDPEVVAKLRWAPDSVTCVVSSQPSPWCLSYPVKAVFLLPAAGFLVPSPIPRPAGERGLAQVLGPVTSASHHHRASLSLANTSRRATLTLGQALPIVHPRLRPP